MPIRPAHSRALLLGLSLLLLGPIVSNAADANEADARFKALYTNEWTWRQQQFSGYDDEDKASDPAAAHLPNVDAKSQATRLAYWNDVLKQLDAIPANELSAENRVNLAIYKPQVENLAASIRFRDYEMPFNADSQFWSDLGFMTRRSLHDENDARAYIAKLDDVPRYFDEQTENMRAGLKRGFSVPRAVLDGRDVSIASYAEVKSPIDSEFYKPFKELPHSIPADVQAKLRDDAQRAIAST
jgi:uncharacterized protein (DUF885 family)